jgi:hypothetical protein
VAAVRASILFSGENHIFIIRDIDTESNENVSIQAFGVRLPNNNDTNKKNNTEKYKRNDEIAHSHDIPINSESPSIFFPIYYVENVFS